VYFHNDKANNGCEWYPANFGVPLKRLFNKPLLVELKLISKLVVFTYFLSLVVSIRLLHYLAMYSNLKDISIPPGW